MIAINPTNLNASMVKGDSGVINISNSARNFETGDKVTFTVKKELTDTESLISIVVEDFNIDGTCTIDIPALETDTLPVDTYFYDIVWEDSDGNINTLVKNCDMPTLKIKQGVTNG